MEKVELSTRDAVEIGKKLAEAIQNSSPYLKEGIKIVTRIVYRELRKAGYEKNDLMHLATAILECVVEEMKERR